MSITIDDIRKRWSGPDRPKFAKQRLWDEEKQCGCAQGDILFACGIAPKDFPPQEAADKEVAKRLGISLFHSVLLRVVNDSQEGCPEKVLQFTDDGLGSVLGPNWRVAVAFGEHMHSMNAAAQSAAGSAARIAAQSAARDAAWDAAQSAAWAAAGECVGISHLKTPPFFLPMFGITDVSAFVEAANKRWRD